MAKRYTNALVAEFKELMMETNKKGEKVLNVAKWEAWKAEREALGDIFPSGSHGKVIDTPELTSVKEAIYNALGELPYVATSGKKGYIIDDIGQLVEAQLLLRVKEPNKAGMSKARFENVHKATKKAMNKRTPKKKK